MLAWYLNLSLKGKFVFWGSLGLISNLIAIPLGFVMLKILGASIAVLLAAAFMPGENTGDDEDRFHKFGKKDVLTSMAQIHCTPEKLEPLLFDLSGIYEKGLSQAWARTLAKQIRETAPHKTRRESFPVSFAGEKSKLMLCWSHEDQGIKLILEGAKEPIRLFKSRQSPYSV